MNNKIFLVIGKSYSGKSTLVTSLLEDRRFSEIMNLKKLVRYTTRKRRINEIDGIHYHFINDEYYEEHFKNNGKCVITEFDSEFGHLKYITDFSNLEDNINYILDADPESIKPIQDIMGKENVCVIFLATPNYLLFQRFIQRDDNTEYSDKKYKEISRRFLDDTWKFGNANTFLAGTRSIIVMDDSLLEIKSNIINLKDEYSMIMTPMELFITKFDYEPEPIFNNSKLIMSGLIPLCNGNIALDTENQKVLKF